MADDSQPTTAPPGSPATNGSPAPGDRYTVLLSPEKYRKNRRRVNVTVLQSLGVMCEVADEQGIPFCVETNKLENAKLTDPATL